MGKLIILSGKVVCRILSQQGFIELRQKGSHIIMQKQLEDSTITLPIPNHKEIKPGTLNAIIRQSGLSKSLFLTD